LIASRILDTFHTKIPLFQKKRPARRNASASSTGGFSLKEATRYIFSPPDARKGSPCSTYPYPVSGRVGVTPTVTR
jgi:hypothetical protein